MNTSTMADSLDRAGVDPREYCIGGFMDETLCLRRGDASDTWEVFYYERGKKQSLQVFGNEDAACFYMYADLIKSYVMSKRLVPAEKN